MISYYNIGQHAQVNRLAVTNYFRNVACNVTRFDYLKVGRKKTFILSKTYMHQIKQRVCYVGSYLILRYLYPSRHTEISLLTDFISAVVIFRGSASCTGLEYKFDIDGISWSGANRVAFIASNFMESGFLVSLKSRITHYNSVV